MNLPSNLFNNYTPPQVFLCQADKTIIGELQPYDFSADFKFNTYSEISLTVDKTYINIIEGKIIENPYYDLIDSIRIIYIRGIGHFIIQDVKENIADSDTKIITAFSLEYAASTKYLDGFRINTGEDDSLEYVYHIQQYGVDYSIDSPYKPATNIFDPYERYYIKEYTDTTTYIYSEIQIVDADAFASYDEPLYVKAYPNIRFYWPSNPNLSLLHIVFAHIPEWKVGHVDKELWYQERTFSEERISVYDFLYNTAAETFKYVMEWDSLNGVVNFYMTEEDGVTSENNIQTLWDTDVYISKENLASSIDISYSTDDIRTKLKVTGGDDIDIRDVNIGQKYIMNLSFYDDPMWLGDDLCIKYREYAEELQEHTEQYTQLISAWSGAYNEYNELMNHVPVDVSILRVGDKFTTLYCTYYPIYEDDATDAQKVTAQQTAINSLKTRLDLFHVNDDTKHNKTDNVLMTLENANSDSATIRVYYSQDKSAYQVYRLLTNATTGAVVEKEYTLAQWTQGLLTAENIGLSGFTVKSIGTLGAYLCVVKDETVKANVEEFGIRLLQEKQDVYTKIFITQTEGYLSKEDYQCLASDEQPIGEVADGTRWLDTDSENADIWIYQGGMWVKYNAETHQNDYENYARFIANYQKLQVVQEVLVEKERIATFLQNGYAVENRRNIFTDELNGSFGYSDAQEGANFVNLVQVAADFFNTKNLTATGYSGMFGILKFTIPDDINEYAVYVLDGVPYVAYSRSQGVCLAQMNRLSEISSMENYFTEGELIRLSPFLREDEYSDSNFVLTGYESEEEQISVKQSLLAEATKELKKICQPKLSFSVTMANIMAIPEFVCLKEQFRLGNFVRVKIRDGYVKRSRLLEVHINFDDLSDFSCTFGDLVTTKDEVSKTADLLQQAVTAGKTVASSASKWQKGADKATSLDKAISEGLKDAALSVSANSGQSIVWNERGILGRKLIDGTEDQYYDEQFMLTNNKLVFTTDSWQTSQGVLGEFEVDGVKHFGLLANAVVGGLIRGSTLEGGTLNINDNFIVDENGSVTMKNANINNYVNSSEFADVTGRLMYRTEVISDGPTVFSTKDQTTTLRCIVYSWDDNITADIPASSFNWIRSSDNSTVDTTWNNNHKGVKYITITHEDIQDNATFHCEVDIGD